MWAERYPPSFLIDNAITVGAIGADNVPAEFSNFGHKTVQLFAPGCGIRSTISGNGFARETGTSQAAPFVSLTAALIWAQRPGLPPLAVKRRILKTADPLGSTAVESAAGILNLAKAISVNKDIVQTIDQKYHFGRVVEDRIAIAADGDTCEETQPLLIRKQLVRIFVNHQQELASTALQQGGETLPGKLCSPMVNLKDTGGHGSAIQNE